MSAAVPRGRLHHGWAVVAVVFLAQLLAIGTTSYGFGLLVKPIAAEYGLARADVNSGLILLLAGMAAASPFLGRALDRLPGRMLIAGGALTFALGCAAIAWSRSLWLMAVAAFLPLAAGAAALGPLSASTLTARWFDRDRGRALGVVSVATSAGGLIVLPPMAFLVDAFGWRMALAIMGAVIAILVVPLALLVLRERDAGQVAPADAAAPPSLPAALPGRRWSARELLGTRDFWLLTICIGLIMGVDQALLASIVPHGTDRGLSLQAASLLVSAISGSAVAGKLVIGVLSDRMDMRWLLIAVAALTEVYLGCLLIEPGYWTLLVASLLVGAAIGGVMPLWAAFVGARFGPVSFGTAMGLMVPVQMPLVLACLRYAGHTFDVSGRYEPAFAVFAGVVVIAALAILPVRGRS